MLVELVEHNLRLRATFQFDDDAHAVAIALVAHVADVIDYFVVHQLGDAFNELGLVHLVRNLCDDDRESFLGQILSGNSRAHHEAPAAGFVGVGNAGLAVKKSARGEIGPLHVLQHFGEARVGVLHKFDGRVEDLGEIVRRNVGGHADRDAARTIHN